MLGNWAPWAPVAIDRHHGWAGGHIVGDCSPRDWDPLQSHQSLSNLSIGGRINLTTLYITEEVVQGIITTPPIVIRGMLAEIATVAHWVIDWTVRGWLLRGVVAVVAGVVRVSIISRRTRVHLGAMAVIVRSGSCKVLQVSHYCSQESDRRVGEDHHLPLHTFTALPIARILAAMVLGGSQQYRVVGVGLQHTQYLPGSTSRQAPWEYVYTLTCFFKSWGRLNAFPQKSHL